MNIALLDDNIDYHQFLSNIIHDVLKSEDLTYTIDCFSDTKRFMNKCEQYDVVFLDVELGEENGIDIAKKITQSDIIFVSSHKNYVFHAFHVSPFSYILKQDEKQARSEIKRYVAYYKHMHQSITIQNQDILLSHISYFSQYEHDRITHIHSKEIIEKGKTLKEIHALLPKYFIQINRSEIINMYHVENVKRDVVLMDDGTQLYASRRREKILMKAFIEMLENKL
ncbi:LytR/AlgR family response regulator transcription factor [Sharpea azabuensis]|uniref:LytR/AlgR family response regulator transcription factor n=1 Tax=Sharpea azabuensis TaxID=322505 RepID=UPI00240A8109|nr:LytTR family transcriptional regulator DNA-binding domain-containing protein [Sharpea azabuensis]MDD6513005.1 LytTR family transcriptional regulator DNA-binding domain-containing protein [Sharpea azabuensis]